MEPANSIIHRLGGATAIATAIGVHRTRVTNWKRATEKGGSGGRIPARHIQPLIEYAKAQGIALEYADFFTTEAAS